MKNHIKLSVAALLIAGSFASSANAQEKKIPQSKVPVAVITAFKTTYPSAKIKGTNQEVKAGTVYYEIESKDGAVKRDILYAADGGVTEVEEIIPAAQIPSAVQASVTSGHPNAKVKSVEKNTQGSVVTYEILMKEKGKKAFEVSYNPDGTIVTKTM